MFSLSAALGASYLAHFYSPIQVRDPCELSAILAKLPAAFRDEHHT